MWNKIANMKFDVVIGNPPYQGKKADSIKQWIRFTDKCCEIGDVVALVTPNSALSNAVAIGKRFRKIVYENNFGFVEVNNHKNNWFPTVGVETCHWIIQRDKENAVDPILIKINPFVESICNKVVNESNKPFNHNHQNCGIKSSELLESGENEILFSGNNIKYTNESLEGSGQLKVVFPFSVSYSKAFITDKPTGLLNVNVYIECQEEGENILNYTMSNLFKFVAKHWQRSNGFVPFVRRGLVDLGRDKTWTDEELYKHFNLTQEEIDYVEQNS